MDPNVLALSTPHPMSESIDKWMFFTVHSGSKSTVVCIDPLYFVTFRHGSHRQLQVGDLLQIFHGKSQAGQGGHEVKVVGINEGLDLILLESKDRIVQDAPQLVAPKESECFLLAGFGDPNTPEQLLVYNSGIVHTLGEYGCRDDERPDQMMGPFFLETAMSSPGDSAGGCWSAKGLIGLNSGITPMPPTPHPSAISQAAVYSPKNVIIPSTLVMRYLKEYLDEKDKPKPSPKPNPRKRPHLPELDQNILEYLINM